MHSRFGIWSVIAPACFAVIGINSSYLAGDAPMASGMRQLVTAAEKVNPKLQTDVDVHLIDSSGEVLVQMHLKKGTSPDQAVSALNDVTSFLRRH